VDIEAVRSDLPVEGLARFFTPVEQKRLLAAGEAETRVRTFFRWWTRKEAVLKAEGSGLSGGLDALDISGCPPELARFPPDGENWWRIEDLDAGPGYAAAVAAPPGEWTVRWRER
jgi:4'-phosphopantetheinyl transferase